MSRALELCFQLKQYDALHQIAEDLSQDTGSEMITRVCHACMRICTIIVDSTKPRLVYMYNHQRVCPVRSFDYGETIFTSTLCNLIKST